MKVIIDIDKNVFTRLLDNVEDYAFVNDDLFAVVESIRNGTLLDNLRAEITALAIDRQENKLKAEIQVLREE